MPAGRPRAAKNRDLPPRLKRRPSGKQFLYYYLHPANPADKKHPDGWQEPIGKGPESPIPDTVLDAWRERERARAGVPVDGFLTLTKAFREQHLRGLAVKTQSDYENGLDRLDEVFGKLRDREVVSSHVRALRRKLKQQKKPTMFNNLKALLSSVYNWGRDEELTTAPNPCIGVKDIPVKRKKLLVTDDMFLDVYDQAEQVVKDWMDLAVIVGPRVSNVLKIRRTEHIVRDRGQRWLTPPNTKTDQASWIRIEGDLAEVVDELLGRERKVTGIYLVQTDAGQPVTYAMLKRGFDDARARARAKALEEGREWKHWQRRDLRRRNASDADTIDEAQRRLAHTDRKTTSDFYYTVMRAGPGKRPRRAQ